eukprot:gene5751-6045_t
MNIRDPQGSDRITQAPTAADPQSPHGPGETSHTQVTTIEDQVRRTRDPGRGTETKVRDRDRGYVSTEVRDPRTRPRTQVRAETHQVGDRDVQAETSTEVRRPRSQTETQVSRPRSRVRDRDRDPGSRSRPGSRDPRVETQGRERPSPEDRGPRPKVHETETPCLRPSIKYPGRRQSTQVGDIRSSGHRDQEAEEEEEEYALRVAFGQSERLPGKRQAAIAWLMLSAARGTEHRKVRDRGTGCETEGPAQVRDRDPRPRTEVRAETQVGDRSLDQRPRPRPRSRIQGPETEVETQTEACENRQLIGSSIGPRSVTWTPSVRPTVRDQGRDQVRTNRDRDPVETEMKTQTQTETSRLGPRPEVETDRKPRGAENEVETPRPRPMIETQGPSKWALLVAWSDPYRQIRTGLGSHGARSQFDQACHAVSVFGLTALTGIWAPSRQYVATKAWFDRSHWELGAKPSVCGHRSMVKNDIAHSSIKSRAPYFNMSHPQNSCSKLARLFARLEGKNYWNGADEVHLKYTWFMRAKYLKTTNKEVSGWFHNDSIKRVILLQDPMERFMSAYLDRIVTGWFYNDSIKRVILLRDPMERFMSAYLDRVVRKKFQGSRLSNHMWMKGKDFGASIEDVHKFLDIETDWKTNDHLGQQVEWCGLRRLGLQQWNVVALFKKHTIKNTFDDLGKILKLDGYLDGWGVGKNESIYDTYTGHQTNSEENPLMTIQICERLKLIFAEDYAFMYTLLEPPDCQQFPDEKKKGRHYRKLSINWDHWDDGDAFDDAFYGDGDGDGEGGDPLDDS